MLADNEMGITDVGGSSRTRSSLPFDSTMERSPLFELRGSILDVGIFKDTLLPTLALNSGLAVIAYGVGRYTDTVEHKDLLWPGAQIVSAWWAAVGRRVIYGGLSVPQALSRMSRPEQLLLTGVTLASGRLFYRRMTDSRKRGMDDPKYAAEKKKEGFWDQAFLTHFMSDAIAQTFIVLPFTAPFYHQGGVFTGYHPVVQAFSVGLFSAGLALQVLADSQKDKFVAAGKDTSSVNKEGVWSIVRRPDYLGDALIHFSYPLLLYGSDMLAPIELLGPIVNYFYLRYRGADTQTESTEAKAYTGEKKADYESYRSQGLNFIWPSVQRLKNQWTWIVVGAGALGAAIEQGVHTMNMP